MSVSTPPADFPGPGIWLIAGTPVIPYLCLCVADEHYKRPLRRTACRCTVRADPLDVMPAGCCAHRIRR